MRLERFPCGKPSAYQLGCLDRAREAKPHALIYLAKRPGKPKAYRKEIGRAGHFVNLVQNHLKVSMQVLRHSDPSIEKSLFLLRNFLDPQTCADLREAAFTSPTTKAPVYLQGSPDNVHENVRKTTSFHPPAETVTAIHERLFGQKSALETHFGISLTDCEPPQFLHYQRGDFFVRHQDGNTEQLDFDHLRIRRISLVVFLNNSSEEPRENTFSGGLLNLYKKDSTSNDLPAFSLLGETGLLLAFTADTIHEVAPVTGGERFTIISWFR